MVFYILDSKTFAGGKQWFLCKGKLDDFLKSLRKDFYEYKIQRRIVRNVYLDGLYQTIKDNSPIPPITLTASKSSMSANGKELWIDMDEDEVDILDGLQRTFRLWIFIDLLDKITSNNIKDYKELILFLRSTEANSRILDLDFVNTTYLKTLFDEKEVSARSAAYREYDVYVAIWTNLSDVEIIQKMLVLNAGQRPVSSTHQYELLFLHYFDKNKIQVPFVQLLREKDPDYFRVRKGDRKVGQYTMTSIIIALQSFIEQKPLRIVPTNYIDVDSTTVATKNMGRYFSPGFLNEFIHHIYQVDEWLASRDYNYISWFGKDTTLSGIFAAIGKADISFDDFMERIAKGQINFRLDEFSRAYDELASTRVNVGNVLRKAIYKYTMDEINNHSGEWKSAFNNKEENEPW